MRTLLKFLCIFALVVGLSSRGNEDKEFESIDFKVTGIELHDASVNSHIHVGTSLAERGTIIFEAKGKNKDSGFMSEVSCGSYRWGRSQQQDIQYLRTICSEDWRRVTITSALPHTIKVVITPNATGSTREIRVIFGGTCKASIVYIGQSSMQIVPLQRMGYTSSITL